MRVIISGGGTGGHIFPAIAVADAIRKQEPEAEILFIGAEGKMEMERVPKAGYRIEGLWISGFQRRLTRENLMFPLKVIHSMVRVRKIIRDFKPDVAVGFGGYASGPALRAAASMGIPTVLQEQNSYAGITNKILARKAKAICVAYEGMNQFFEAKKVILTGNPVRGDIGARSGQDGAKRAEGLKYFGLDEGKQTIVILGGSLGARTINEAVEASASLLERRGDVQVLWQCGRLYEESYGKLKAANLENVRMRAFIDRMDLAYAVADIAVARAGALTISELCIVGLPAILVPSPNVAEDHQTKNAMALVERAAAILVKDADAKDLMIPQVLVILGDKGLMSALAKNIGRLGRPNASRDIANAVINAIREK